MIYFKLVIASTFLFQLVLGNRNVKPGCGFGRFFGCFRPQVLEKEAIEPVEEFFNAVESDTGAIVEPSNSDTKTTRSEEYFDAESDNYPTPESSTIQNQPDFDLDEEFARWLPRFKKRSEYITWSNASPKASKRIVKEMQSLMEEQNSSQRKDLDFLVYVNEDNFYHWMVKFIHFQPRHPHDKDRPHRIAQDMQKMGIDEIVAEVIFTSRYPEDPPLIRVLSPEMFGSYQGLFCATALTRGPEVDGHWRPSLAMSSVLHQFRQMILEMGGGLPYRTDPHSFEYGFQQAIQKYSQVMGDAHRKWKLPKNLKDELMRIKD